MLRNALALAFVLIAVQAAAVDYVAIERDGKKRHLAGKVTVEAADGGLLLLDPSGEQWLIEPNEIVGRTRDEKPFQPLTPGATAADMLRRLPEGFQSLETAHYVLCYNTSKTYAQWCGALLERLYRSYFTYWEHKKVPLRQPEFPLVVVICADADTYRRVAGKELGKLIDSVYTYYYVQSNRIIMQDLTGLMDVARPGNRQLTPRQINATLSSRRALPMVATVVHEATHQMAYNSGLHQRLADVPLWVNEGLAVYFETPDLRSTRGWTTIGKLNTYRLVQFRKYLKTRPDDSLTTLLTSDLKRFRDPRHAPDTYAEAWALTYFLMRQRPQQYLAYLKVMSEKRPLISARPEDHVEQFKRAFGRDLAALDREFLNYMRRLGR